MFLPKRQLNDWLSTLSHVAKHSKGFRVHEDMKVDVERGRILEERQKAVPLVHLLDVNHDGSARVTVY